MNTEGLRERRIVLIGGTSHAGKSSVAQVLAARLGWDCRSTDKLARHPGRPWALPPKVVPEHVAEHYTSLSGDDLVADVMRHYRDNVWSQVEGIVAALVADAASGGLVLEGSALWPEWVAKLNGERVAGIWLTASDALLEERIRRDSAYEAKTERERVMIDKFVGRTLRYNAEMMEAVRRLGLAWVDVENAGGVEELADRCGARLQG